MQDQRGKKRRLRDPLRPFAMSNYVDRVEACMVRSERVPTKISYSSVVCMSANLATSRVTQSICYQLNYVAGTGPGHCFPPCVCMCVHPPPNRTMFHPVPRRVRVGGRTTVMRREPGLPSPHLITESRPHGIASSPPSSHIAPLSATFFANLFGRLFKDLKHPYFPIF